VCKVSICGRFEAVWWTPRCLLFCYSLFDGQAASARVYDGWCNIQFDFFNLAWVIKLSDRCICPGRFRATRTCVPWSASVGRIHIYISEELSSLAKSQDLGIVSKDRNPLSTAMRDIATIIIGGGSKDYGQLALKTGQKKSEPWTCGWLPENSGGGHSEEIVTRAGVVMMVLA